MKDFLLASLYETKKIPTDLLKGGLRIDYEHGLVYPLIDGMQEEEILSVFDKVFPKLDDFRNTFHKSWEKILETDQEELWAQAVLHYFTTYGLESLGIDNEGFVYLPDEIDCTPELRKFRVIGTISSEDLCDAVVMTLNSGIALKQFTIDNYLTIIEHYGLKLDYNEVNNKEVRTILQYKAKFIPDNGEDIVRLLNYVCNGKTMLVKNRAMFQEFSYTHISPEYKDFAKRLLTEGKVRCAEVFYRYKPVFLALRKSGFKKEINKIRRLAKRHWIPMSQKQFISTMILNDSVVTYKDLQDLSTYDLVKIFNKLNYVIYCQSVNGYYYNVFPIRSGSLYIDKEQKTLTAEQFGYAVSAKSEIIELIRDRLNPDGIKQLLLPEGIELAFPTSEKSFIGDVPLYSQAFCGKSSVIGIAWDHDDLDLSALLEDGGKVGWNSRYTDSTNDTIYSGDCTRGGAEAIKFKANHNALIMQNVYYGDIKEVNLFISNEKEFNIQGGTDNWGRSRYIYDPNNIIFSAKLKVDGESKVLGLYEKKDDDTVFTFVDMSLAQGNVCANSELTQIAMEVIRLRGETSLKLSDVFNYILPEEYEEQLNTVEEDDDSEARIEEIQNETVDLRNLDKTSLLNAVNDLLN